MAADSQRGGLFRPLVPNQHSRVTYAELFFDLVFVFAVTQISHTLLGRFTPLGALQTTLLFLAVWWVWVYTAWITNWLNPELTPVRVLLFSLMLGGLVLSTSIPKAFESRGLWFAAAYAAMQVGRTSFLLASIPRAQPSIRMNAVRILSCGWGFGPWRWPSNICRRRRASGYRNMARLRSRTGQSKAVIWRSAAPGSSSSRSANPSS
jgi:hypothetical protein